MNIYRERFVPLAVVSAALAFQLAGVHRVQAASFFNTGAMKLARDYHTATLLPNGKVLVAGGYYPGGSFPTNSAELFDPANGTWTLTGPMNVVRSFHTATVLLNGKVLVAGSGTSELYDPATGTWSPTNLMKSFHTLHTATLLADGRVLVAGGFPLPPEIYDPVAGTWTTIASLAVSRSLHTATLLPNGKVLFAGGEDSSNLPVASAELYDPATGTWTNTGSMNFARRVHTATLLPNGTVLVAGGDGAIDYLASAEIYNPASGTWTNTGAMITACGYASATLRPDGLVLVAAGYPTMTNAEVYHPATGTWTATASLHVGRYHHTATLLAGAQVLIAGGYTNSAEIYDWAVETFTSSGPLKTARYAETATLLPNGKVFIAGGFGSSYLTSTELYDPVTGTNTLSGSLNVARGYHTATLLLNGKVLLAGGTNSGGALSSAELYDPAAGTNGLTGNMNSTRSRFATTLLANGNVLVTGGYGNGGAISNAEVFDPASGAWTPVAPMNNARYSHTATLLPNGKVFVAGGFNTGTLGLSSTELYDPVTGTWTPANSMVPGRAQHTATLLPSGKVLVAGGNVIGSSETDSTILYDPSSGQWTTVGPLADGRFLHSATLLLDGRVLVAGGFGSGNLGTVEVFDPATKLWTWLGSVLIPRYRHAAVLLPNGKALVIGGFNGAAVSGEALVDPALGFNAAWQPQISTITSNLNWGDTVAISGSKFRGVSEGSYGTDKSSSADCPVVQLRNVETLQTVFLRPTSWATNSYGSAPVTGFLPGWTLATVFVNGIPSAAAFLKVTASGSVTLSNLAQEYDGMAHAVSAATVPPGLPVSLMYNGSPNAPTNSGSYTVVGVITDPFFFPIGATNTLVVSKATASVTLGDLTQPYSGTARIVSVTTAPPGMSVTVTYNGSLNAPTNPGSYIVVATIVDANYQGSVTNALIISPGLFVDTTSALRSVDARHFGLNTAIYDYFLDTDVSSNALREIGCLALRFPGGSLSDEYHWATGTTLENPWQWGTSFGNFMHVATNLPGAQVFITVNYGTGTTNEAADWVRFANGTNQCGFKYWEVGNECYGSWETDRNTNAPFKAHDALTYAMRFKDYYSAMKAADPTIKVGIPLSPFESFQSPTNFVFNPRTGFISFGWTSLLLDSLHTLGVTPDFAVDHFYPQNGFGDNDAKLLQASTNWIIRAADLRQQIADYMGPSGTNIELVCTENNCSTALPGRQTTSLVNGLYLADSLSQILKTEFNSYVWWDLRNGADDRGNFGPAFYGWRTNGDQGIMLEDTARYPMYYTMKLMQFVARPGDNVLNPASSDPLLAIYAARKPSGAVNVLVINKSPGNTFTRPLVLGGFTPNPVATLRSYGIPQDEAARTNAPPAQQDIAVGAAAVSANLSYDFPPYSLTQFSFAPAAPVLTILDAAPGGPFVFQVQGQPGVRYIIQTSTNLTQWTSVATNVFTGSSLNYTNPVSLTTPEEFWRAVWVP